MNKFLRNTALFLMLPLTAALNACGSASGESASTGELSLAVTDAPVDEAEQVVVEFTGVRVQNEQGDWHEFTFDSPRQIDLLHLAGGASELLLDSVELPAGNYQAIRLVVNAARGATDSYIVLEGGGAQLPMYIPSGNESGLKLNHSFTIAAGGISAFTVDFDLRKSVVKPRSANQDYKLKPSLRLVDNLQVGRIVGTVAAELLTDASCDNGPSHEDGNAVYLYEGWGATPDDVGSAGQQPIASAPVLVNANSSTGYSYTLAYVAAGDYTVAFTCQAMNDQPDDDDPSTDDDDDIAFVQPTDVSITAGTVADVNFE